MSKEQELVERLKRNWAGPMSEEDVELVQDMRAFLQFCIENGLSSQMAFATLAHDVGGLLREETAFVPKVKGYSSILRRLHEAKTDPELQADLAKSDKWD